MTKREQLRNLTADLKAFCELNNFDFFLIAGTDVLQDSLEARGIHIAYSNQMGNTAQDLAMVINKDKIVKDMVCASVVVANKVKITEELDANRKKHLN